MSRVYPSPEGLPNWKIGVSHRHGVRHGRHLFVGGQADLDEQGTVLHPGDLPRQTDAVLRQLAQVVQRLEGRLEDIVKVNVFYRRGSVEDETALLRRISDFLPGEVRPVISLVTLERLPYPGMAIILDAVAVDNRDGQAPRRAADVPDHWRWPAGAAFSHGVRCGELMFVAAQSALDASGRLQHAGDIVAQARLTIANIGKVLRAMGADLDDVVKLNTWFHGQGTDEDWRRAARVRSEAFRYPGPGATGVPVAQPYPDGALIRQECWAMRGLDGKRLPRSLSWPVGHWDWPIPVTFQQGVKVGNWIFLGGQYACDIQGKAQAPGNRVEQARITMDFIGSVLAGFGAGFDDLVKTTCFYASDGTEQALHDNLALRSACFRDPAGPATSVSLETMGLEGLMLEIEGIAILA